MARFCVIAFFVLGAIAFAAPQKSAGQSLNDSIVVSVQGSPVQSQTGIWWPKTVAQAPVVVWFHGGMSSGNCAKGLVAGNDYAKLFPGKIVVSASACREHHWVTKTMIDAVDAALDSVAARRKSPVERVSLVGVSDGALGVLVYSLEGRRTVDDRLLMSSFGKMLGEPRAVAGVNAGAKASRMRLGRYRFLQGGKDRLYPSEMTVPWITEFCKAVQVDCELRFDPEGEHDWAYWKDKHLDWIREATP